MPGASDTASTAPLSSAQVAEQLLVACQAWVVTEQRFQTLAETAERPGSRLQADNAAVVFEDLSLALADYVKQRAANAARMFRALHRLVLDGEPGTLRIDATVMYPLMRAALEDSATLRWLQSPQERSIRLTRAFRALAKDNTFYIENHRLLALATAGMGHDAAAQSERLTNHMMTQKELSEAYFRSLAGAAGIDATEATRSLATSAPVQVEYGSESIEYVSWKLLSDLSHFSYMMLRHLEMSPVPQTDAKLEYVVLLELVHALNHVADGAAAALDDSLRPDTA
jgi:hypothetical protein